MISKQKFIAINIQPFKRAKSNSKEHRKAAQKLTDEKRIELGEQWEEMLRGEEGGAGLEVEKYDDAGIKKELKDLKALVPAKKQIEDIDKKLEEVVKVAKEMKAYDDTKLQNQVKEQQGAIGLLVKSNKALETKLETLMKKSK